MTSRQVLNGDRRIVYSTCGEGPAVVVFQPLGVSRLFVTKSDFVASAAALGLRLICVDRPGIGGTSPVASLGPRADHSRTVRRRLEQHTEDVAFVVQGPVKLVGMCAGTPYCLHYARTKQIKEVTLVTPWVPPECEHAWSLARAAQNRALGSRSFAAFLLAALQLNVAVPLLRLMDVTALVTEAERPKVRAEQVYESVRENARLHSVQSLTHDIRVCLSTLDEFHASFDKCTVFAGDADDLVNPRAITWLCDKICPTARLFVYRSASHAGVQRLRRDDWLRAVKDDSFSPDAADLDQRYTRALVVGDFDEHNKELAVFEETPVPSVWNPGSDDARIFS